MAPGKWSVDVAAIKRGVAVVGSTSIDRNVIGPDTHFKIGGVTTYAGLTYRRHGLPTWIVSNVAPPDASILRRLTREGIQIAGGQTARTTRFVNHVHEGRRHQEVSSFASAVGYSQLAKLKDRVDCIHLGPLHPEDINTEVFERMPEWGCGVVFDVQGLVRRVSAGRVEPAVSEHLPAAFKAACIVKSDEDELRLILDSFGTRVEDLMGRFDIAEWVVTSGLHGGCIHSSGQGRLCYPAEPASAVVDPTGAGDVFFAAYSVARLRDRKSLAEAARYAARLASEHVAGRYLTDLLLGSRSPAAER